MAKKGKVDYIPEHIFQNMPPEQRLIVYIIILKILNDKLNDDDNIQYEPGKRNSSKQAIESLILNMIRAFKKNINDKQEPGKDEKKIKNIHKINHSLEILEKEIVEKKEGKKLNNIENAEHKEHIENECILKETEKYEKDNINIKECINFNEVNENSNDFLEKQEESFKSSILDKEYIKHNEHIENMCILKEVENQKEDNTGSTKYINDIINEDSNDFCSRKKDSEENKVCELPKSNYKILYSKVRFCNSATLQCQTSKTIEPNFIDEPLVSNVSVVLSRIDIQIFVEALTKFSERVINVKSLDKKVFLNQCQLVTGTNKLFLKGFIQENIEYSNIKCIKQNKIEGMVKKITLNIPFQCTTKVNFSIHPKVSKFSSTLNFELLDPHCNGIDNNIKSYEHFQFLNEKVFCNINSTEVFETCSQEGVKVLEKDLVKTYTFKRVRKKIIVTLNLSLLQNQKVFISKAISH